MYGMINQGIKDLVCNNIGEDVWKEICKRCEIHSESDFDDLKTYDDALTYQLVESLSHISGKDPAELLETFGRFWITYTAEEGYGDLMDLFGENIRVFLTNLNQMHERMSAMMPDLVPPKFTTRDIDERTVEIIYTSTRPGLAPMVKGLMLGLADKFSENIEIHSDYQANDRGECLFLLKFV